MKKLFALVFLFCAAPLFAANPTLFVPWTAMLGSNGVTVVTNPASGRVIFSAPGANIWTLSNGTVSNTVASTVSNLVFSSSVLVGNLTTPLAAVAEKGTNQFRIRADGALLGREREKSFGPASDNPDVVFWQVRRLTQGDRDGAQIFLNVTDNGGSFTNASSLDLYTSTIGSYIESIHTREDGTDDRFYISGFENNVEFVLQNADDELLKLKPTAADGSTAHLFDTSIAHTSGNLLEVKNSGVVQWSLASTNGFETPEITAYGGTSAPWLVGSLIEGATVTLNTTNYVEVAINGVIKKVLIANE